MSTRQSPGAVEVSHGATLRLISTKGNHATMHSQAQIPCTIMHTTHTPVLTALNRITSLLSVLTLSEKIAQLQTTHTGAALPGEGNSTNKGYIARLGLETYSARECLHGVCDQANTTGEPG